MLEMKTEHFFKLERLEPTYIKLIRNTISLFDFFVLLFILMGVLKI